MKTKEQVIRHIANCKFSDEDWGKVLEYCKKHKWTDIHRSQQPKDNSTYEQFTDWVDNGFGSGDIVYVGRVVGIVGDQLPTHTYLAVSINDEGRLVQEGWNIDAEKAKPAPKQERQKILAMMEAEQMMFNVRLAKMVRRKGVKPYERAEFTHWGKTCYGIASSVDDKKIRFTFIISDGKLKKDAIIRVGDAVFKPIGKKGINIISKVLAENGLMWDAHNHELVEVAKRAEIGGTYWYISDKFSVVSAIEYGKGISTERYEAGNYFMEFSEAFDLMMRIRKTRAEMKKGSQ